MSHAASKARLLYDKLLVGDGICGKGKHYMFAPGAHVSSGANDPTRGQYPWMASLGQGFENGTWRHSCGATIVDRNTLVTAAHCMSNKK